MDVLKPEIDHTHEKARLYMYCTEKRISRELFWSGFGFQVWCQMLTHLVQSDDASLFLIDEPDIYLHSDLQRQLIGLLKNLGPDILIATHSTEIIVESDASDIILINKSRGQGKRIRDIAQLGHVFADLGSNINPILTQLAKTRRAVFVEGLDFSIISKFARRLGVDSVANKRDFAVIQVEGFNPERVRTLKEGMEVTLGTKIATAAILDRDYRSDGECEQIKLGAQRFCDLILIHTVKEIENFLLIPAAIERAVIRKAQERQRRNGEEPARGQSPLRGRPRASLPAPGDSTSRCSISPCTASFLRLTKARDDVRRGTRCAQGSPPTRSSAFYIHLAHGKPLLSIRTQPE